MIQGRRSSSTLRIIKIRTSPDVKDLVKSLKKLYGTDGKGGKVGAVTDTVAAAVAKKLDLLTGNIRTPDPWLRVIGGKKDPYMDIGPGSHVSLAKLLMIFCGVPLAATGQFDEVQFIFYAFNARASFMKDLNIASLPINITDFIADFKERTKTSANLPIGQFLSFLRSNYIVAQTADAWGLTDLYKADKEGNLALKKAYEDATILFGEKQKRLEAAYGPNEPLEFKMPAINMYVEAVKVNDKETVDGNASTVGGGANQTILRIHVFDKQCTSYESFGQFLQASRKNELGVLGKAASEVRKKPKKDDPADTKAQHANVYVAQLEKAISDGLIEALPTVAGASSEGISIEDFQNKKFRIKGGFAALKNFVASTMPSIIYGSSNSAVIKASVSSMNNPQLATVNMLRGGMGAGTTAQGARDAGVPLQVSPTQLSMEIFGCPLINFGQQFFVDFQTGTSVDNLYMVTGVDHSIESGKFTTNLKLVNMNTFGKYTSLIGTIEKTVAMAAEAGEIEKKK